MEGSDEAQPHNPRWLFLLCLGFVFLNLNGVSVEVQAQQLQVTAADPSTSGQMCMRLLISRAEKWIA
jgi:hypothetical protein